MLCVTCTSNHEKKKKLKEKEKKEKVKARTRKKKYRVLEVGLYRGSGISQPKARTYYLEDSDLTYSPELTYRHTHSHT